MKSSVFSAKPLPLSCFEDAGDVEGTGVVIMFPLSATTMRKNQKSDEAICGPANPAQHRAKTARSPRSDSTDNRLIVDAVPHLHARLVIEHRQRAPAEGILVAPGLMAQRTGHRIVQLIVIHLVVHVGREELERIQYIRG